MTKTVTDTGSDKHLKRFLNSGAYFNSKNLGFCDLTQPASYKSEVTEQDKGAPGAGEGAESPGELDHRPRQVSDREEQSVLQSQPGKRPIRTQPYDWLSNQST